MSYEVAKQQVLEAWVPGVGIEASSSHTDFFAGDHLVNTRGLLAIGEVEKAKEYFDIWRSSLYPNLYPEDFELDNFSPHYMMDQRKTGIKGFIHGKIANKTTTLPNGNQVSGLAGAPTWNIVALEIFEAITRGSSEQDAIKWFSEDDRIKDLIASTRAYNNDRLDFDLKQYFQVHPYELTLGNGVLARILRTSSRNLDKYETKWLQSAALETSLRSNKRVRKMISKVPAFDIAVDAQAKQNVEALLTLSSRLGISHPILRFITESTKGFGSQAPEDFSIKVSTKGRGDNVTPPDCLPIEYWLASSRYPQISEVSRKYYDLLSLLPDVAKKYRFGIPTLMAKDSEQQPVQADQGSVSPRLVFEIVRNISGHREPGQILFGKRIPGLDEALAEIFENTAKTVGDTFPRHINPTDGSPTTAKNPLSRRQKRAQAPWIPTATALLDAKAKLEKYGIV